MSLTYAILAALSEEPLTGYDLAKSFDGSVGFFWTASHQQIYRELEQIYKNGWVKVKVKPQEGKPDRKIYSLSKEGMEALRRWMVSPTATPASRDPLLIKLFAGPLVSKGEMSEELSSQLQKHKLKLDGYKKIKEKYFSKPDGLSAHLRFQYYTLKRGIYYEEAWIKWCEEVISDLNHAR